MTDIPEVVGVEGVLAVLAATIDAQATSFLVQDGASVFPTSNFQVKIDNEILLVGARSGKVFSSLTRGQEGTAAWTHPANAGVFLVVGGEVIKQGGGLPAGGTTGEVLTKLSDADGDADWEPSGGSSAYVVRKFEIAYDDAGLASGKTLFTPTVGDLVLDFFLTIEEAWDGTTPMGDFGIFPIDGSSGFLGGNLWSGLNPWAMDAADTPASTVPWNIGQQVSALSDITAVDAAGELLTADTGTGAMVYGVHLYLGNRFVGPVNAATPIKFVVSQDAKRGSAAPGATQGAATFYFATCTPT